MLRSEVTDLRRNVEAGRRRLKELEGSRDDRLKRYGQHIPVIMGKIETACRRGLFHAKPRGPIGMPHDYFHFLLLISYCSNLSSSCIMWTSLLYPRMKVGDTMHLSWLCCCRRCHIDFLCALYSPQFSSCPFQILVTCLLHQGLDAYWFWGLCHSFCSH